MPYFRYAWSFRSSAVPGFTSMVISASACMENFVLIVFKMSPIKFSSNTEGVPPPINIEDTLLPVPSVTALISPKRAFT